MYQVYGRGVHDRAAVKNVPLMGYFVQDDDHVIRIPTLFLSLMKSLFIVLFALSWNQNRMKSRPQK